jgi:cell wall-associated NlpC family hydrolase
LSPLIAAMVAIALTFVGSPYVWKGKGSVMWTPTGLTLHTFGKPVFDCSGLVTVSLKQAGGKDFRATHNAQAMFDQWAPAPDPAAAGVVRLYGKGPTSITHVAISLGRDAYGAVQIVEAAGGDSSTTCPKAGACVRQGRERRSDFVGARVIP